MTARTLRYIVEIISALCLSTGARYAIGATATALVSVTILAPLSDGPGLALSALQLDMRGKSQEELTIINHSASWREIRVDLQPTFGSTVCELHYSPMNSRIPPGGIQVVRLMDRGGAQSCQSDHRLIITDPQAPAVPLFDVPVNASHG